MVGVGHFDVSGTPQLGDNKIIKGGFALGQVGAEQRMVSFAGDAVKSETMTVFFATQVTSRQQGDVNPVGPGVGIVEFASGGGLQTRIEFDLPVPRQWGPNFTAAGADRMPRSESASNLVAINVAGASVISAARLDSALALIGDPTKPINGINIPPTALDPDLDLTRALRVSSWLSRFPYSSPQHQKLKRTAYITNGNGVAFGLVDPAIVGIPNLARRVRFFRDSLAETLSVLVVGINTVNTLNVIAAGSIGPLELQEDAYTIVVRNTGAAAMDALACEFELEI